MDTEKYTPVVLIADDEPIVRTFMSTLLNIEGYTVLTAEDGYRAIQILTETERLDVALCDIRMPGPSGMELREIILKQRPDTKVVLLTGDTFSVEIPAEVMLWEKPLKFAELHRRLSDLLKPNSSPKSDV